VTPNLWTCWDCYRPFQRSTGGRCEACREKRHPDGSPIAAVPTTAKGETGK
jgi:hypothetical protein